MIFNSLLSKWNVKHLVAAWSAYWLGLVAWGGVALFPAIWRLSRPDVKGSASINFGDGALSVKMLEGANTIWSGGISVLLLTLLIAVPPLVLWAWWLSAQRGPPPIPPEHLSEGQLGQSDRRDFNDRRVEEVEVRRPNNQG